MEKLQAFKKKKPKLKTPIKLMKKKAISKPKESAKIPRKTFFPFTAAERIKFNQAV